MMSELDFDIVKHWLAAALILVSGWIAIKLITLGMSKALKRSPLDAALYKFIINGMSAVLWIVLVGTLLSWLGVPIPTFVTVVGVAGAAIALALKDSLANIVGGFIVLMAKPFKKGDYIELNGIIGNVDQIDLLFTSLRMLDNRVVQIPNGMLSTSPIINYTFAPIRRIDCTFNVVYNSNIEQIKEILYAIAEQHELILDEPEPIIGVSDLQNGLMSIDMKVWCETEHFLPMKYYVHESVKVAFDEAGIEIAHPQMDVYVKK